MNLRVLLAMFIGSLAVSSLAPLYYIIRRRKGNDAESWRFHEDRLNPLSRAEMTVKIRPVRSEDIICQICMGKLKERLPHVKCDCGKIFHITCLKRTGFCPYCQKIYRPEDVERSAVYPDTESIECPMCGRSVLKDSGTCECGAIISDEEGKFYCPSCGTLIDESEDVCPFCHERFEDVHLVQCPVCARVLEEGRGVCECGTFVGETCPECGTPLSADDKGCPVCGLSFEIVE